MMLILIHLVVPHLEHLLVFGAFVRARLLLFQGVVELGGCTAFFMNACCIGVFDESAAGSLLSFFFGELYF